MIEVGIVGGTGYTGVELVRLLLGHPEVNLRAVTSRSEEGVPLAELFPGLRGATGLTFCTPTVELLAECDLVFFATPNGVAMGMVPALLERGVRVVDLSADFRLSDAEVWSHWYGMPHACPELLQEAVYGLPETNRSSIREARLVANPGCYPTAVQLGLLPLLEQGLVNPQTLIADTKSGVSGAGRQARLDLHLCETSENVRAYGVAGHRHQPEIEQHLSAQSGAAVAMLFVPHLMPMIRGIHATLYAELQGPADGLQEMFESRYENEPFVDVMPAGAHPETRSVRGGNVCRLAVHRPADGNRLVVLSVIDNLVKGASGQALQNMNLMLGLDESTGLNHIAPSP